MPRLQKTIFTGFAPNLRKRDLALASGWLWLPWRWPKWKNGVATNDIEAWLKKDFGSRDAITFDSGRSALLLALKALGVGSGSEVLVQAYTCVVVVNAVRWNGATPVFVDMTENFFMDAEDALKKITPRTRVIIIQHTFGIPADLDRLLALAKEKHLWVIEDCAHTIGGRYHGKLLGTFGDIGLFSFGSDKVISSVRGGAVITSTAAIAEHLRDSQRKLKSPSYLTIARHLLHYPIFYLGKGWYHAGAGKVIFWLAKKSHAIPRIITDAEKQGREPSTYPARLPNALAALALAQLNDLSASLAHRKKISGIYDGNIHHMGIHLPKETRLDTEYAYLRYPIITEHPKKLRAYAKKQGIILGDWYDAVVAPCVAGCAYPEYAAGSCPHAEIAAKGSVNLPTDESISEADALRIADCINRYQENA